MSEIRFNLVTGDWVIIATERAKRPEDFGKTATRATPPAHSPTCPFCPGREEECTPGETFRIADPAGGWAVRSIPNRFAALGPGDDVGRHTKGLGTSLNGVGLQEVVLETPRHNLPTALLPQHHLEWVVATYRSRLQAFYRHPRIEYVVVFKNSGEAAGSSLEHPHSQIVGTPVVPGQLRHRIEEALRYYGDWGTCVFCRMLAAELEEGARIVTSNASFVAFVPYAALSPFHVWIYPRRHTAYFGALTDSELADLAAILKEVLLKVYRGLDDPAYNFVVRSLSPEEQAVKYFHWYLSLVPRISKAAGFELGTGMFINPALPEASAEFLRKVSVDPSL
jgi:UDPglucose--hexose-1-phosphate uridylyltransferase